MKHEKQAIHRDGCQPGKANIFVTYALARRLSGTEVTVNCLHPRSAPTLALKTARESYTRRNGPTKFPALRTLETAAATPLYPATRPELSGVTGKYFMDCKDVPSSDLSYDVSLQERLWRVSSELLNLGRKPEINERSWRRQTGLEEQ